MQTASPGAISLLLGTSTGLRAPWADYISCSPVLETLWIWGYLGMLQAPPPTSHLGLCKSPPCKEASSSWEKLWWWALPGAACRGQRLGAVLMAIPLRRMTLYKGFAVYVPGSEGGGLRLKCTHKLHTCPDSYSWGGNGLLPSSFLVCNTWPCLLSFLKIPSPLRPGKAMCSRAWALEPGCLLPALTPLPFIRLCDSGKFLQLF